MFYRSAILRIFTLIVGASMVALFFLSPLPAQAEAIKDNLRKVAEDKNINLMKFGDIPTAIGQVIGAALALIGILFFILTIYGGVLWMTSHGNDDQVSKGMHTVIAAAIGMVIVLGAYALVQVVFGSIAKKTKENVVPEELKNYSQGQFVGPPDSRICVDKAILDTGPCFGLIQDACSDNCQWNASTNICEYGGESCDSLDNNECQSSSYCTLADPSQISTHACQTNLGCKDTNVCAIYQRGNYACPTGQVCCASLKPVSPAVSTGRCEDKPKQLSRYCSSVICPRYQDQTSCEHTAPGCCDWNP